jgi:hypothetical protein
MRLLHFASWTCAIALSLCAALPLSGQAGSATGTHAADSGRIAVTIVLTQSGGPTTVLRRTSMEPRNVILVDSATIDARRLSSAIFSFLVMEGMDPEGRERSDAAASRPVFRDNAPQYPSAEETLRQLGAAPVQAVQGVGTYRTVQISVRPLRGRGTVQRRYSPPSP